VEGETGRRERKKRETRRALRRAALQLVTERGVENVTVQDIADAADVSTRTFFNHFACKEDVLVGVDPSGVDIFRLTLAEQPEEATPLQVLRAVLVWVAGLLSEHADELRMQIAISHDNPQLLAREMAGFGQYERVLFEDIVRRSGTDPCRDVYPALAAGAAVAALRAGLSVWRHSGGSTSLADLVGQAFDHLGRGLPPPAAGHRAPTPVPVRAAEPDVAGSAHQPQQLWESTS
jgi:AcrR family transcriptional regulator